MEISLSNVGIDRIERGIRPSMAVAITLPVLIDGKDCGVSVYVSFSAFAPPPAASTVPPSVLVAKVAAVLEHLVQQQTIY